MLICESFGRSGDSYADVVIAGNTFDFPYIHGLALADANKGFVSTSVGAVESGLVKLQNYKLIDLILGKQKLTITGNGNTGLRYFAFSKKLQQEITNFVNQGGDIFISGQYIVSDLYDSRSSEGSIDFAQKVLGISKGEGSVSYSGSLSINAGAMDSNIKKSSLNYSSTLNEKQYIVESPDIIAPSGEIESEIFLTFSDTGNAAGVFTKKGKSRGVIMSIPFESIWDSNVRSLLMRQLVDYLEK